MELNKDTTAKIEIVTEDAMKWLETCEEQPAFLTSLPEYDEVKSNMDFQTYINWFENAVYACIQKMQPKGYAIFFQTDRKIDGHLIDKSFLINKATERSGAKIIWHKIVLRKEPDKTDLYRPTYSHLIMVSKQGKSGKATPDVFHLGKMLYPNAMGFEVRKRCIEFLKSKGINKIVDPFCGMGSAILFAKKYNMDAVGIDIDPEQTARAKNLLISNVNDYSIDSSSNLKNFK